MVVTGQQVAKCKISASTHLEGNHRVADGGSVARIKGLAHSHVTFADRSVQASFALFVSAPAHCCFFWKSYPVPSPVSLTSCPSILRKYRGVQFIQEGCYRLCDRGLSLIPSLLDRLQVGGRRRSQPTPCGGRSHRRTSCGNARRDPRPQGALPERAPYED